MDNDVKLPSAEESLGADNADILRAKRTRSAALPENTAKTVPAAVSAGQLRMQMNAARTSEIRRTGTPAKPQGTLPAKRQAVPSVQPGRAVQRSAQPGTGSQAGQAVPSAKKVPAARPVPEKKTAVSAAPARMAAPAAASAVKNAVSRAPGTSSPAEKRQSPTVKQSAPAVPAKIDAAPKTAVPTKAVHTEQKKRNTPAAAQTLPFQVVYDQTDRTSVRKPAGARKTADIHALIPHQKAEIARRVAEEDNTATRVTDMHTPVPAEATRLSSVQPVLPKKKTPKKNREAEDESEGSNAIISVIKAITYIVSVVVVSVFLAVFIILVGNDVYAFVKDESVIDVTVPEYATLNDISILLSENGIIEYPTVFKVYANLKKDDGKYIAGTYPLSPMMNYDELLMAFKPKKPTGTSRITIPEGYTTDQIIDLFVSKGIGTREKYVEVINHYDFDYWFIDKLEESGWKEGRYYRLDGYLFPDTYEFYNASTEEVVIGKLLKRFNEVFIEAYAIKAEQLGYTVDEILTLASMVEKEGGTQSDFFNISSVFTNRLNNAARYPFLESDATIVYAIEHDTGEHVNPTREHLSYESPYNTHTNKGLPPGPIANPSASAIRAALYPADTKYFFFVSASATVTYYAETLDEHNANVARAAAGGTAPAPEN